ncbi:MAG: hypothetical protein ACREF3_04405 [Acetobacteraceae bacterium]
MMGWLTHISQVVAQTVLDAHGPIMSGEHHGMMGPRVGNIIVAAITGAVTLLTVVLAIRYMVWPGEQNPDHPKHRILDPDR